MGEGGVQVNNVESRNDSDDSASRKTFRKRTQLR